MGAAQVMILVAEAAADPAVPLVAAALAARGGRAVVVETGAFPHDLALSWTPGGPARLGDLDLHGVDAVWIRHLDPGATLPPDLRQDHRAACTGQAEVALLGVLDTLPGRVVDPPRVLAALPPKPALLARAGRLGLETPPALVTNDPAALRAFAATCPHGVLAQPVDSSLLTVAGPDGPTAPRPRRMAPEELADPAGLALSPVLFEALLDKVEEARVTVVGGQLFVATVHAEGVLDLGATPARWDDLRPGALPPAVARRVRALVADLGLSFATVDLVRTREGRWVFLELNSVSTFAWVERRTGLPIAAAVADLLLA